ncbi:MAG: hypothetical protein NW226_16765 [Microscillaceae bacterium]|nr:hypothetical protein [Microscillaceae bacterium]
MSRLTRDGASRPNGFPKNKLALNVFLTSAINLPEWMRIFEFRLRRYAKSAWISKSGQNTQNFNSFE